MYSYTLTLPCFFIWSLLALTDNTCQRTFWMNPKIHDLPADPKLWTPHKARQLTKLSWLKSRIQLIVATGSFHLSYLDSSFCLNSHLPQSTQTFLITFPAPSPSICLPGLVLLRKCWTEQKGQEGGVEGRHPNQKQSLPSRCRPGNSPYFNFPLSLSCEMMKMWSKPPRGLHSCVHRVGRGTLAACSVRLPDCQDMSASPTANADTQYLVEYSTQGLT